MTVRHESSEYADIPPDSGDAPALELLNAVLRRRRLVMLTTVLVVASSLLPTVTKLVRGKRTYSSEALITASARRGGGALTGLAAQFGVAVPGADPTQSPSFFVDLLKSHEMLARVAASRVVVRGRRDSIALSAHYDIAIADSSRRIEMTRREVEKHVDVTSSQKSGIITIKVDDSDPLVASQIAARLVQILSELNFANRRSQASSERKFTERRSQEAQSELRVAEERQRSFAAANRGGSSPDLALERERLARDVLMRQQVYTQLVQAYEQARIEEVRDTPTLTVIEEPYVPVRPDPTGIVSKSVVALFVGFSFGVFLAFLAQIAEGMRLRDPARYGEVRERLASFRHDILRPWRLLRRPSDLE